MLIKDRLTVRQFTLLTFLTMVGDMILIYPSLVTAYGRQDAWICSLLSQPIGILIIWILFKLHRTHPELSLIEICKKLLGPWMGSVLAAGYLFYFIMGTAVCLREVGDFMTTQIYLQTPIRVILTLFLIPIVWGIIHGLKTMGLSSELLAPIVVVFMILLLLGLLPQVEPAKLQPFLETPWIKLLHSTIRGAFSSFGELIVLSMFLPYVNRASHLKRDILLATIAGGIMLTMLELVSLMVFGPILTQHGFYISYSLAQKINIGNFFERIEALMAISWLISTYFKSMLYMFGFVLGIAQLLELKSYKPLILPSALLMFAASVLIGPNIVFYTSTVMPAWLDWNVTVSLVIPLFLLLVHRLRFQRKKRPTKRVTS